jgi:hypothetical protein
LASWAGFWCPGEPGAFLGNFGVSWGGFSSPGAAFRGFLGFRVGRMLHGKWSVLI